MPKVTIIIPTYNNQSTITRTLDSVINQTYQNIEILIVDNGSQDKTIKIVQNYEKEDFRVKLLVSNRGRSKARNLGLKEAKGTYIQLLDSDDEISVDKIERAMTFFKKTNDKYSAYISSSLITDDRGFKTDKYVKVKHLFKNPLYAYNPYRINSVIFKKSKSIIYFDEDTNLFEDWLFWFDNLSDKQVFLDTRNYDAIVHVTGHNSSIDARKMCLYEVYTRCLIKQKKSKHTIRLFLRDISLASMYLFLGSGTEERLINKSLHVQISLIKVLIKFPSIKDFIWKREGGILKRNDYQ